MTMPTAVTIQKQRLRVAVLIFLGLSVGCATVDPQPFAKFSEAIQELRNGADEVLRVTNEENLERFIVQVVDETGAGDPSTLTGSLLLDRAPPFGWTYESKDAPLYVESRRFRAGMQTLNDALARYAALLVDLASPQLVKKEDFDAMATDLNGNLGAASKQLGVAGVDQGLALFSVAAASATHAYIEGQRQGQLTEVLKETQRDIDRMSQQLVIAMELAAQNTDKNYQHQRMSFAEAILAAVDGESASAATRERNAATRRAQIVGLMALNASYTTRLDALGRLSHAYGSLPTAHKELLRAIESPGLSMSTVKDLYSTGKELHGLYKELAPEQNK